jgi:alpha-mannosidase
VLLKAAFPVAVRSTRATYDIQFGCLERPTHWNTSWDYARFETVAHKWVDLAEGDYGVALLNDCKYGHDIKDNLLRITLIKSGIYPDPSADQGEHIFTYSLLPHRGDWRTGGVIEEAHALNVPLRAVLLIDAQGGSLPAQAGFVQCSAGHVIVETIKQAEEGQAWVVRLYESRQQRARGVRLSFARSLARAVECNLVEEEEQDVEHNPDGIVFNILPFEIKTFKVWFA